MTTLAQNYSLETKIKRLVLSPLFWIFICGFFFGYPLAKSISRKLPPPAPVLYQLPSFQLLNQYGKPFGSQELKGKFYIANFFFSSCPTVCPELMEKVRTVQHRVRGLGTHVAIVSFSVDPENDSPQKLLKEAEKYKANPHVWSFLTGKKQEMRDLILDGFKLPMGDPHSFNESLYDIAHSQKMVLVDPSGNIRGFYSSDKDGINQMMIDLGLLVNRENPSFG